MKHEGSIGFDTACHWQAVQQACKTEIQDTLDWKVSCISVFAHLVTSPSATVEADLHTKVTKLTKKCFLEVFFVAFVLFVNRVLTSLRVSRRGRT